MFTVAVFAVSAILGAFTENKTCMGIALYSGIALLVVILARLVHY